MLFTAWLFFILPVASASNTELFITAAGDLRGEISPCGCGPDSDLGGLMRQATYLENQRSQHPSLLYVDLGNNFPPPSEQGKLKIKLIRNVFHQLRPQVILLGPSELSFGIKSLDTKLPYLVSNIDKEWPILSKHIFSINKKRIGIWGYLSPKMIYRNKNESSGVLPANSSLLEKWKTLIIKARLDYKILLFRGDERELDTIAQSNLFNLIITGNNNDDELNQILEMNTSTKSFQSVPTKGLGVLSGRIDISSDVSSPLKVVWLSAKFKNHPEVSKAFKAYDEEVNEQFFINLDRMEQHQQISPYIGVTVCEKCHQIQNAAWKKNRHSHAFETLKKVGKHFDPECLQCHVVGLNQKGFLSAELTPQFVNVQCENCHGPAKAHLINPKEVKMPVVPNEKTCKKCHHGSHSPLFDYAKYYPKIIHKNKKQ